MSYSEQRALDVLCDATDTLTAANIASFANALLACLPDPPREVKTFVQAAFTKVGWSLRAAGPVRGAIPPSAAELLELVSELL